MFALVGSPAAAQTCIDDVTGVSNVCTANDVQLSNLEVLNPPALCTIGEPISIDLVGEFISTAAERFDIGVFIALDGGDARSGDCHRDWLPPPLAPDLPACEGSCSISATACFKDADCPAGEACTGGYNPGTTSTDGGPYYDAECSEDPGDLCGDLEQGVPSYREILSVEVLCQDNNDDGLADVG
ncbi:MAG: hypothetical protein OER88_12125, partial [Planctomycetota bacterium]|nr:hypothetical protein [Planctomycetota bacterium]